MSKSLPAAQLRETRFHNERLSSMGLEVLRLSDLFKRVPHALLQQPERVEFALLLVVDRGRAGHQVDFQQVALAPGTVVAVRPGSVQQWQPAADVDGDVLLIEPQLLQPRAGQEAVLTPSGLLEEWPSHFVLHEQEQKRWAILVSLLRQELDQLDLDDLAVSTARGLLQCLLLTLARAARQGAPIASTQDLMCRRLVSELDRLVNTRPSVASIAQCLGTSPSTLGRACQSSLGLSVKEVIDKRVALEAKRLLVHTSATAVVIGEQLGFSEPTNFLKFFKRCAGMTPEQFRRSQRKLS